MYTNYKLLYQIYNIHIKWKIHLLDIFLWQYSTLFQRFRKGILYNPESSAIFFFSFEKFPRNPTPLWVFATPVLVVAVAGVAVEAVVAADGPERAECLVRSCFLREATAQWSVQLASGATATCWGGGLLQY